MAQTEMPFQLNHMTVGQTNNMVAMADPCPPHPALLPHSLTSVPEFAPMCLVIPQLHIAASKAIVVRNIFSGQKSKQGWELQD